MNGEAVARPVRNRRDRRQHFGRDVRPDPAEQRLRHEADRRAHYDAIVRESERLSRLVDNVLDFSAIERGVKFVKENQMPYLIDVIAEPR